MLTHARRAEGTPLWSGGPGPSPETSAKFDPLTRTVTADRSPDPTLAVPEAPAALRRLGLPAPNLITEPQAEGSRLGKQKAAVTVTVIADRLRASLLCACRAASEAQHGRCFLPVALHQKHHRAAALCPSCRAAALYLSRRFGRLATKLKRCVHKPRSTVQR